MNLKIDERQKAGLPQNPQSHKASVRSWVKARYSEFKKSQFNSHYVHQFLERFAQEGQVWAAFQAIPPEPKVDWQSLAKTYKVRWAFPKIEDQGLMNFYLTEDFILHPQYEILEPNLNQSHLVKTQDLAGVFVPGLAFDNRAYRLGRGKGFYDSYLKNYTGLKVGLCYAGLFLHEPLPLQDWDVKMDFIVSEKFIFKAE